MDNMDNIDNKIKLLYASRKLKVMIIKGITNADSKLATKAYKKQLISLEEFDTGLQEEIKIHFKTFP